MNELIYKKEKDAQIQKHKLNGNQRGKGERDKLGVWN